MEATYRGKPLQARWALVPAEFKVIITSLAKHTNKEVGTWLAAYLAFMYNMIARLARPAAIPPVFGLWSHQQTVLDEELHGGTRPPHTNSFWKPELEVLLHLLVGSMA